MAAPETGLLDGRLRAGVGPAQRLDPTR